ESNALRLRPPLGGRQRRRTRPRSPGPPEARTCNVRGRPGACQASSGGERLPARVRGSVRARVRGRAGRGVRPRALL
ncbi:MAG: hypothetical protein AVDCRST_MAG25-2864, partial [uncultured Rubrobacteraceae bacterium]